MRKGKTIMTKRIDPQKIKRKEEFIKIAQENTNIFNSQDGYLKDNKRICFYNELLNIKQKSKCYSADEVLKIAKDYKSEQKYNTQIIVQKSDSLSTAREIISNDDTAKVLVLNFASYKNPGGRYLDGCSAQEECLCRQSTLYPYLEAQKDFYNKNKKHLNSGFYGNEMIVTPNIKIFRDKDNNLLSDIINIGVITSAAINKSWITRFRHNLLDECNPAMLERMDCILGLANLHGYTHLILGAYGCGVFKNDATEIAEIWKFLLENKYKGAFKVVIHSIPDDKNWSKFCEVFN